MPYLASLFQILDDEDSMNNLEITIICNRLKTGRNAVLNKEKIVKNSEARLGDKFEPVQSLVEILTARYQEKVLFGRAAVALTRFQNIEEIISNKCVY